MADTLTTVLPPSLTSWIPGETPLSTWPAVSTVILSYLAVILGLRESMKDRSALKLGAPFRIHNAFLSLSSLILLVLIMEEVIKLWYYVGAFDAFCAHASWTRRLEFYYMVNHYLKFIEFLDTVFLVLKKRPLSKSFYQWCLWYDADPYTLAFLHVFHHSTTALLTFLQLESRISGAWTPICLNLAVHVVMYYYYLIAAGGAKPWWKKHLTTMQMLQFVIDIFVFSFGLYQHLAFTYRPHWPHMGDCAGDTRIAIFGSLLIASFLGLFANFYVQTYAMTGRNGIGKDKDKH